MVFRLVCLEMTQPDTNRRMEEEILQKARKTSVVETIKPLSVRPEALKAMKWIVS